MRFVKLILALLFLMQAGQAQKPGYKVAFNVFEDTAKDNYDVYVMNMDGSGRKNITNTPGVEWVYYAYKNKLYFISDKDTCHRCYFLYEMDSEGNNMRKISNLQLEDSWMGSRNNGKEMVVTGRIGRQVRQQLFLVNTETGSYRQLTNDTVSYKGDPLFSPKGDKILLRYRPDRKLRQTVPDELWWMDLDGKAISQLTYFPKSDTTTPWFEYHAGPPQWNSKHDFISYMSYQQGDYQVYAISADGKKQWKLTEGQLSSGWHSWSSDGEWMAMDKSMGGKQYDIYLLHYATGKTTRLTDHPKTEQAPVIVEVSGR